LYWGYLSGDSAGESPKWSSPSVRVPKSSPVALLADGTGGDLTYKVKCKSNGSLERHKERLVAKGYAQTYGLDYDETFILVAKMATVRSIIALAAQKGWNLHQMDVKNAFLNGEPQDEVYMEQLEVYVHREYPTLICRLKKAYMA